MNDTTITIVGNLTDDPKLRYTPNGTAVAKFRVASTPRYLDKASGQWKDAEPLFMNCILWREAAENAAESLPRGARVIVTGRLRQRSYETREGEKRTVIELETDEIGPSLRYATAKVSRMTRTQSTNTNRRTDDWSTATPARPATVDASVSADDEPPF